MAADHNPTQIASVVLAGSAGDQGQHIRPEAEVQPYCGTQTLVNRQPTHLVASPMRCRMWECESCAEVNRQQLMFLVASGRPRLFLTLTTDPANGASPPDRARRMVRDFARLRRRIEAEAVRRETVRPYGKVRARHWPDGPDAEGRWRRQVTLASPRMPFCAVFEHHESGEPHLHIAIRGHWLTWAWLQREWIELHGASQVHIERIDSPARTGRYVAKYMGGEPHRFEGCKRYWRSQHYAEELADAEELDARPAGEWELVEYPMQDFVAAQLARGWSHEPAGRSARLWPPQLAA